MLDKRSNKVLNIISDISEGNFKVIDADDIIARANEESLNKSTLSGIIKTLAEMELIKVKTASLDMYCLASTPKARISNSPTEGTTSVVMESALIPDDGIELKAVVPTRAAAPDLKPIKRVMFRVALTGSFIGALLGGAIVAAFIKFFA